MQLTLHSAWRSSAAYRVRIGLNLKGLAYDIAPVNLVANQHQAPAFAALNPQRLLPALEVGGRTLTQSLAILEWLDETVPQPALLPADPFDRAVVRSMAQIVASDIHPVNNLRILRALTDLGVDEPGREAWIGRWITDGFSALETLVARHGGDYAFGDTPTLADCCLVPQVYNAERFRTDLAPFPAIRAVAERARAHPAFAAAHPNQQPDAIHA
ncbi:maleylacetoacetate isomerase [Caulobacter rhizosphaerae]|jgi:maleylacetoacetate isomerase/maleylpyruvate isomerase|uniref:Maleylacetoacetate isomerase/maleylpyruvate isomerase n=1 Tax=Caulobacter rhizosphaerae TaxID=2010972 RepID=A0ABU1MXL6_9CAUL|nr:maleylacetoacetate isomerase [Caulobacter rhizosphaerae]MDR6530919.1 maleylacetoacetate isomerase/maleylpyruvate isomerase [Caulobacter rhizosphaerae]GGL17430.1 maleylacetoacetate isomerase [Caulobacter rhizosphaerae]